MRRANVTGSVKHSPDRAPTSRRRRRWIVLVSVVGVAVVAAGALAVSVLTRDTGRQVSVDEAVRPTGSTRPSAPSLLRPAQGVYLYEGEGMDALDKPPLSRAQGPQLPATVTHRDDGCWTFRIDFSTNHWQTWVYCPTDENGVTTEGGLVEEGGQSFQKWDLGPISFDTTTTFDCPDGVIVAAGQEPGDEWNQRCEGTSTGTDGQAVSAGPSTFVGVEELEIGGRPVAALRYRRQREMSGAQRGTEQTEAWFSAETGLPLRNTRTIRASTSTVIGDVTYTETGTFEAASTEPRP